MTIHTLQIGIRSLAVHKLRIYRILAKLEYGYMMFALLMFSQAFFTVIQGGAASDAISDGNPLIQKMWAVIYAIAVLLCGFRWRLLYNVIRQDKLLLLLLAFVLASITWSAAPDVTFRRAFALVGTNFFALHMATKYSLKQQFVLISRTLLVIVAFSYLFGIFLPQYGLMSDERGLAWQGVLSHKNQLGRIMCLGVVLYFILLINKDIKKKKILWLGLAGSLGLVVLSTSKTALVIMLILLLLLPFLQSFRWNISLTVLFWMFGLLFSGGAAAIILSNAEMILSLMNRDITLTGRTELWSAVWEMITKRPIAGYGFNGFWLGLNGESAYVWLVTKWDPPHSHNGWLDIWLDLGIIGVAMVLIHMIKGFVKAIRYIRMTGTIISFYPLIYLMFMFLYNLTENTILRPNSFFWVVYVSTSLSLSIAMRYYKRQVN